jgi:hypothetical protein
MMKDRIGVGVEYLRKNLTAAAFLVEEHSLTELLDAMSEGI